MSQFVHSVPTIMILMGFYLLLMPNYTVTFHSISWVKDDTFFIADVPLALLFLILTAHHRGDLEESCSPLLKKRPPPFKTFQLMEAM